MTVGSGTSSQATAHGATTLDLIAHLTRFEGSPEQFLIQLLAFQCRISAAQGGAIFRPDRSAGLDVLAAYPQLAPNSAVPAWIRQVLKAGVGVLKQPATQVLALHSSEDLYGANAKRHIILVPILTRPGEARGLEAFFVESSDREVFARVKERLEFTASLLSLYEMRLTLQSRQVDFDRLRMALETLCALNDTDRFKSAAMAMCNEVASRWKCARVSLGMLKGHNVQLVATSHTEKVNRKMALVKSIEGVMEECIDQDVEIVHPSDPQSTCISRVAEAFSREHGESCVVSLPLRKGADPIGVLTAETQEHQPMTLRNIESLRLTCDLAMGRLENLHKHDRWIGAKAASCARRLGAAIVGPRYTWVKLASVAVAAFLAFAFFARGEYNVDASFELETASRYAISAPFDGYISEVLVEPDEQVVGGETILARLDESDLRRELVALLSERAEHERDFDTAVATGKIVDSQIAKARLRRIDQRVELLEHRLERANLVAPIDGRVLSGDLKQRINAPVKMGDRLFDVGPVNDLFAELEVPEDCICEIRQGMTGELATASDPSRRYKFTVVTIHPVAQVVDQRNVFIVRVALNETDESLRPGMTGMAKICVDKRVYAWLWTHRLVDWIRMKMWW